MAEMGLRQEPTNYTIELIDKTRNIFVIDDVLCCIRYSDYHLRTLSRKPKKYLVIKENLPEIYNGKEFV